LRTHVGCVAPCLSKLGGRRRPLSEGMKDLDQEGECARLHRHFAVGHASFVLLVFLPPLALTISLASGPDVAFFAGTKLLVALVAVFAALALPVMHACFRPTQRFLLTSVWAPAAVFAFVAIMYRQRINYAIQTLPGPECYDTPEKKGLDMAYNAANELYSHCQGADAHPLGKGVVDQVASVKECTRYQEIEREYGRELRYLETLEQRLPCAGICYGHRRLFVHPGVQAPACGPIVAAGIRVPAKFFTAILAYSIVVMLLLIPAQYLVLTPLVARYNDALLNKPMHVP